MDKLQAEVTRLQEAIRKTRSTYLRLDYKKRLRKLERQVRERYGEAKAGKTE